MRTTKIDLGEDVKELNKHWQSVVKGPTAHIVKVKQKIVEKNQYKVLSDKDDEEEVDEKELYSEDKYE